MASGDYLLTCAHCGKVMEIVTRTNKPRYCSNACRQAAYRERRAAARKRDFESVSGARVSDVTYSLDAAQRAVGKLVLMACSCPRWIWSTAGNVATGRIKCGYCNSDFRRVA